MVGKMSDPIDFWYEFGSTYSYLSVMRIEAVAQAAGTDVRWRPFLLGPIFAQDRDIAEVDVLADILSDLGRDPAAIMEASRVSTNKEGLRSQTEEAKRRGIFGAPSFTVGEELFWGNERLGTAIAWSLGLR